MIGIEIEEYFWLRKKIATKLHAPQVVKKEKKQIFFKSLSANLSFQKYEIAVSNLCLNLSNMFAI